MSNKLTAEEREALGRVRVEYVPEQERNFDMQHYPARDELYVKGQTMIEGKVFNIVDYVR